MSTATYLIGTRFSAARAAGRSAARRRTEGLLFADVADAHGGRIAVFRRVGLAVFETCEPPAAKRASAHERAQDHRPA
ncbi:hypothetical protein AAG565_08750 [Fontimonas sp. SYSU GA230001]|uniref:hypothetical protein n=1 Tax=Fontimonas sp. SYSU GA230001 TaxID=3142450 RepID=UPI0032B52336